MHFYFLPTIDYPIVWPCVGVALLVFIPVSIWHDRAWKRTLAEYGAVRLSAGAADPWPPVGMSALIGVQPWLILTSAGLLAAMTTLGVAALLAWPHGLPFFDGPLNYFDRPYVTTMVVAGVAAVIGAVALGLDLARSPWARVASKVRRATHAPSETRKRLFSAALAVDPGVTQAQRADTGNQETAEPESDSDASAR
jgi:hypothetical protein